MADILQLIDNAIEDYSVSGDAMRLRPGVLADYAELGTTTEGGNAFRRMLQDYERGLAFALTDGSALAALFRRGEQTRETFMAIGQLWSATVQRYAEVFDETHRQLVAAGVISPPPPVDPMQRALEARRNRNTGPAARMRVPRRIDARRAR